jgi:type VI secretion system secreted protein Hcp
MPIYVKYGEIKGDLTAEGHKGTDGWFEVSSFQWGVGRGISAPTGSATDRESSAPSVSEIVVTKTMDVTSYRLLDEALQGEGVACVIHFCKTDKGKLETYCSYTLEDCMVSGYSVSSGGDRPSESISINFTKIEYGYVSFDDKGASKESPKVTYDIAAAAVV